MKEERSSDFPIPVINFSDELAGLIQCVMIRLEPECDPGPAPVMAAAAAGGVDVVRPEPGDDMSDAGVDGYLEAGERVGHDYGRACACAKGGGAAVTLVMIIDVIVSVNYRLLADIRHTKIQDWYEETLNTVSLYLREP